jgi:hypothetical protein
LAVGARAEADGGTTPSPLSHFFDSPAKKKKLGVGGEGRLLRQRVGEEEEEEEAFARRSESFFFFFFAM